MVQSDQGGVSEGVQAGRDDDIGDDDVIEGIITVGDSLEEEEEEEEEGVEVRVDEEDDEEEESGKQRRRGATGVHVHV